LQHGALARRKRLERRVVRRREVEQGNGEWRQVRAARRDRAQRLAENWQCIFLAHESMRPGAERFDHQLAVHCARVDQDSRSAQVAAHMPDDIDAIDVRQQEVDDHHCGFQFVAEPDRFRARARLPCQLICTFQF
jgi:hypothetical protein